MSAKVPEGYSPLMTSTEAACFWRVTPVSIARWAIRFGWRRVLDPMGRVRYLREDVERQGKIQLGNRNRGQFKPKLVEEKTA